MNTLNVNYTKTFPAVGYTGSSGSYKAAIETIKEAMEKALENSPIGLDYVETDTETSYKVRFFFSLGEKMLFCMVFNVNSTYASNGTYNGTVFYCLHDKENKPFASALQTNNNAGNYSLTWNNNNSVVTVTISFSIDYMLEGTSAKVLYGVRGSSKKATSLMIATLHEADGSEKVVAGLIYSNSCVLYNINTMDNVGSVWTSNFAFSAENKILLGKLLVKGNAGNSIIGYLDFYDVYGDVTEEYMTRVLIDVEGTRYREVSGPVWVKEA